MNDTKTLHLNDINLLNNKYQYLAGIDEAGRGPLAGSVVISLCILDLTKEYHYIRDSKQLNENKRKLAYQEILDNCIYHDTVYISASVIDEINILNATKRGMYQLINKLSNKFDNLLICIDHVKLDINNSISITKGDDYSLSIAAASVLSKVLRDNYMAKMDKIFPGYGFSKNAGYGTSSHYEAIKRLGITKIHRRSFRLYEKT